MTAIPLTPARRNYGWRTWHDAAREAFIAILLGIIWILLDEPQVQRHDLVHGALTALGILLAARGMETALSWAIEQSRFPTFFRVVLYILGGALAAFLSGMLSFDPMDHAVVVLLSAVTVAFILHHNRKRSDRVLASIARLKEHEFAEKELEIAREMQHRLLPPPLVEREGFRVTARTHAAHIVGGDFYDVLRLSDQYTAVLAADVSGKGIAASLIMASCKAMIPFLAASGGAPEIMRALNASLCEQLQRREFVAMCFVRFEPLTGSAEIVNAGMPDPLLVHPGGVVEAIVCHGERLPLGAMRSARYDATTITLECGQRLLLYSDGLSEATVDGAPIGHEVVERIAARARDVDELIAEVHAIPNLRIEDDAMVVSLERR